MELDAVEMLSVSPKEREGMLSSLLSSGCLPGSSFQAPTRSSRHLPRATGTTESDDVDEVSSNFIAIHADERPAGAGVFSDTDDVFKWYVMAVSFVFLLLGPPNVLVLLPLNRSLTLSFYHTDFHCSRICLDTMQSAYVTHCGHSFWYAPSGAASYSSCAICTSPRAVHFWR